MGMLIPKLTEEHLPGLGSEHVVGASGLGVSVIIATLVANTNMSDAELIAGPPNDVADLNIYGPVIHSLGTNPTFALAQAAGTSLGAVVFSVVTMDHSAVYVHARSHTDSPLDGVATRIIAIR